MILSIAGEDPDHVMSTGGSYLHQRIADVTTTHLEFPSGLRAHIFVSWLHPYKEQKLVVVGDQTMAVFDDTQSWADKLHLYSHRIRWGNNLPVTGKGNAERVQVAEAEPLFGECKQFPDVIQPGKNPPTDGREGLRILRILCASQASFHSNGARIQTKETIHPINKASRGPTIHDTAIFDHGVSTRDDSKIWNFPHIPKASSIGKGCHSGKTSSSVPMWPLETDARYKRMFPYNRRYA